MSRIEQVTAFAAVCAGCRVIGPVAPSPDNNAEQRNEALKSAERRAIEAGWSMLISGSICPGCRKIVAPPNVEKP